VSGNFALECAMDELAVALNMDPVELRIRNEPAQDEYKKMPFSSRSSLECYRAAAERFGWSRRDAKPGSMRDRHWRIGWGMATANYPMNFAPAAARARLLPHGSAEVTSATSDMGPGTWTSMTQVAADTLGLPIERVKFTLGDTRFPKAVHGGSMTMASVGSVGRVVNPKLATSQCLGAMMGGLGMALMEQAVVDGRNGRVPNANLAEYAVPVHADKPPVMDVIFVDEHDPHVNPLGVKGIGELAMVGVTPPSPTRSSTRRASASETCRSRRTSCCEHVRNQGARGGASRSTQTRPLAAAVDSGST
jgi:CO/xanthine dehydrogenase Mo-binding subunit